jgi:hypothetical protein
MQRSKVQLQFYETKLVQQRRFLKKCFGCLVALGGGQPLCGRIPRRGCQKQRPRSIGNGHLSRPLSAGSDGICFREADEQTAYAHAAATELPFDFGGNLVPASMTGRQA